LGACVPYYLQSPVTCGTGGATCADCTITLGTPKCDIFNGVCITS
jgi:hypothetical protein